MEVFSTVTFTIEYVCRFWTCDLLGTMTHRQFFFAGMNMLDFLAIMPFYIEEVLKSADVKGLRVLRSVRLIRLFRVLKLGKYNSGLVLMTNAVKNSIPALSILMFFLGIAVVFGSSMLYFFEKLHCPDYKAHHWTDEYWKDYRRECEESTNGYTTPPNEQLCCVGPDGYYVRPTDNATLDPPMFRSILETMWWSVVTMTTVGYGDQVPRTMIGKIIAGISMMAGIVLISLPVAIVGNKFQEAYDDQEREQLTRKKELDAKTAHYLAKAFENLVVVRR